MSVKDEIMQAVESVSLSYGVTPPTWLSPTWNGRTRLESSGLPILPWFMDLAHALNISISDIEVELVGSGGCSTCGDGSLVVYIHIRKS